MAHNPYRPPNARLDREPSSAARRGGGQFWLRFYLSPFGRTGRLFYWLFGFLPLMAIGAGCGLLVARQPELIPYFPFVMLLMFWPQVVLLARRLHDVSLSGWWAALFWAVPLAFAYFKVPTLIGTVVAQVGAVVLGFIPGTAGPNGYGNDPRGGDAPVRPAAPLDAESELYQKLLAALERQLQGDETAALDITPIARKFHGARDQQDPVLSPQQMGNIKTLLGEWRGMFSFVPGRIEGLPHLISLLKWTRQQAQAGEQDLYAQDDWKKIVELRGPVDTVLVHSCTQCQKSYPRMGTSGFLDIIDLLCGQCGAVTFKGAHEPEHTAACPCGGVARVGCPGCGATESSVIDETSPYAYFSRHSYYQV